MRGLIGWARQPARRRALAIEAGLSLARARLTLLTRRFVRAVNSGGIALGTARDGTTLGDLAWSIQAVGERLWWRPVCFDRGLAFQAMARRRGIDARLHYGIGKGENSLAAHVWVSVEGEIVLGGEEAGAFREVAVYPDERAQ